MQYNQLNISNRALTIVKQNTILSLTENTKEAEAVNFLYYPVKAQVLSSYNWKNSTINLNIELNLNYTGNGYRYEGDLPSNFIKLVNFNNNFIVKNNKIYSNTNNINLIYVANLSEEEIDLHIIDYFIYKLALELSYSFINDLTFINYLRNITEEKFKIATNTDSKNSINNVVINEDIAKSWINIR